ncbi:hypothetical protein Tco_0535195 [Tanacetum coccineum]
MQFPNLRHYRDSNGNCLAVICHALLQSDVGLVMKDVLGRDFYVRVRIKCLVGKRGMCGTWKRISEKRTKIEAKTDKTEHGNEKSVRSQIRAKSQSQKSTPTKSKSKPKP